MARENLSKITIFVIDNQPIFCEGIRQALSECTDVEIAGECELSKEAYSLVENLSPDIALVCIGTRSEFALARQISTRCPQVKVIIISTNLDDEQLLQAMKSGAAAFLDRNMVTEELLVIIKRVSNGEYPINDTLLSRPDVARKALELFRTFSLSKEIEHFMTPLSQREMQIMRYVAEGNPNKYIADTLNISPQTIKNHITSIMRKLNANDRTHAVVLAINRGWIDIDEISGLPSEEGAPISSGK
jgi:DNA-binding NarL/FixJ family response regulator